MNEFTIKASYGLTGDQPEAKARLAEPGISLGRRFEIGQGTGHIAFAQADEPAQRQHLGIIGGNRHGALRVLICAPRVIPAEPDTPPVHHPVQIAHPHWGSHADVDKAQAEATRLAFLRRYADRPVLVLGTHFAGPTGGRLVRDGDAFRLDV